MSVQQQNDDGSWSEAVPLPYFIPFGRSLCGHNGCKRKFWRRETYELHFRIEHLPRVFPSAERPGGEDQ